MPTDERENTAPNAPIVVPGAPGAISVEAVGERPVMYTGQGGEGDGPSGLDAALRSLFADAGVPSSLPMGANMSEAYEDRVLDRRIGQLEAQASEMDREDFHAAEAMATMSAVGKDVAEGVFLEGGQAVLSGAKKGVNETLDVIDEAGDALSNALGTIGTDADGKFRVFAPGEWNKMEAEAEKRGKSTDFLKGLRLKIGKDEPTTTTGKMIEGVSQFATGFAGGGRVLRGWKTATKVGMLGKSMAQGAIADFTAFDGHQERLSNLLAEAAPEQAKPIFEFLAANPNDGEITGRMKAAVEGMGLGVATDGVIASLKALRAARVAKARAREVAQAEGLQIDPIESGEVLAERTRKTERDVIKAIGDPAGPLVTFKSKVAKQKAGKASAQAEANRVLISTVDPNSFDINFARIETPDDVKAVISTLLERNAGDAEAARRGVRTWEETQKAAGRMDWVAAMANRRTGDAVNAETAFAFREALNASATKLLSLAQAVKAEPSIANQFAFRKMLATHRAIQLEFMGARAESGRALNAFKIPAGTPERALRQIDSLLADAGGANAARDMADKLLGAAAKGDQALNTFVAQGAMARSRSMIRLVYTNSLLSGLGTGTINVAGNVSANLMNLATRAASPRLARMLGDEPATEVGEAAAIIHGQMAALRDMFRLNPLEAARRATAENGQAFLTDGFWRALAPGIEEGAPSGIRLSAEREEAGMVADALNSRPLGAAAWGVEETSLLGRTLDVVQMIVESPSNFNAATDDFFKVLAARGELNAQAFRQAMREAKEGGISVSSVRSRMAEIVDNPTSDMLDAAEREMHELTFSRSDGKVAQSLSSFRRILDSHGPVPVGTILLPFLRTPANLISLSMRYTPLAPFMARFRKAIAEGGATAEVAKAQMAIGTALWSVWAGMAMDGQITGRGPANQAQRDALMRQDEFGGAIWQPYSVKVGDRWISYQRLDPPFGTSLSLVADFAELARNDDWDGAKIEEASELSGHIVASLGQAFFDRTSFQSAMDITQALTSDDASWAERAISQRAAAMVPASGLLRNARRGEDPYMRETHNAVSAIMNTIPNLSEGLPVQRDLWGRPRTYQTGLGTAYDAVLPLQIKPVGASAIDLEMLRQGTGASMPQRSLTIDDQRVSLKNRPDIYSEFVRRAGEPAFEHLEAVVSGTHKDSAFYESLSDGPDGEKAQYIRDIIRAYRADARAQILELYGADLEAMAAQRLVRRAKAAAEVGEVGP